ncbi:PREDICTED: uncharacterized protein LOC107114891 [Gekko japonicus]|uniref:Uncharacterized protein LOC107114891 n=1 Tax=Gekko japonicus TaxID=146911 RepID=A0ABM1KE46_GEKJA|nr:PREDICTED: uncharacterized protein LOC107114891 [Gekko japonicus]
MTDLGGGRTFRHPPRPSMPLTDADPWACPSFGQMFNPSRMFSWHRSFTISAPWRKAVKKTPPPDGKVVLTNLKILSSEMAHVQAPSPTTNSLEDPGSPKASLPVGRPADVAIVRDTPVGTVPGATFPALNPTEPKCHLPRLAKFESEDSGVELPSGPNSLSTPTSSVKSFVLHSRDSSCDSGVLSASSSPAAGHMVMRTCADAVDACFCILDSKNPEELCEGPGGAKSTSSEKLCPAAADRCGCPPGFSVEDATDGSEGRNPEQPFDGECLGDEPREGANTSPLSVTTLGEKRPPGDRSKDSLDSLPETPLEGHPLRRYPTSDSLDEYMDECCKLSEVNQGNAKALGSGLGYLEHICQLIEKIGQLQEHNLRLQKQVCGLQKEQKMNQLKEEYFLQQCSCSAAASVLLGSHQEVKNVFAGKSRPHSLLAQNGNASDLSSIPETGAGRENPGRWKEGDAYVDLGHYQLLMGLKLPNGRRSGEAGHGEGCSTIDGQANLPKEPHLKRGSDISRSASGESHAWGRMRDLVRKTRGRHQSRLGLASAALKRSCPQLYRPDIATSDLSKAERNSMIALGPGSRNESAWPF